MEFEHRLSESEKLAAPGYLKASLASKPITSSTSCKCSRIHAFDQSNELATTA